MKTGASFMDLPGEVRQEIYDELLISSSPIRLSESQLCPTSCTFSRCRRPSLNLYPLIAQLNKQIHREATAVMYGRNHFIVKEVESFARFLDKIGFRSSSLLCYVQIDFPDFQNHDNLTDVTLQECCNGLRAMDLLQKKCCGVAVVEMALASSHHMEVRLDKCEAVGVAHQMLSLVDLRLKMITSLREVKVQLYEEPVNVNVRQKMQNFGWTIETINHDSSSQDDGWDDGEITCQFDFFGYDDFGGCGLEGDQSYWWEDFYRGNMAH